MKYKYVLFDLDGTITDPKEGITKSVQIALRHLGIEVEDRDTLCPFIGPPLAQCFSDMFGLDDEQQDIAIAKYRENYSDKGMFECELYDGIKEMLAALKERGHTVILATSKPTVFAKPILEHYGVLEYFDYVSGSALVDKREDKSDIIRHAIEAMNITDIENAVMIGDRKYDAIGAKANGMDIIGVLYGYGGEEELSAHGVTTFASTPLDLLELV